MRLALVTPAPQGSRTGNETTTLRWKEILEHHGHETIILREWNGEACDTLIALHAHKSMRSIERYRREYPHRPILVALTGTDVYGGLDTKKESWRSLEAATRILVLQPLALEELPDPIRRKARVVYQSVSPVELSGDAGEHARTDYDTFELAVVAHMRDVKDPFRAARASRLLPRESNIRVIQIGRAMTPEMEHEAAIEEAENPRFIRVGSLPRHVALARLGQSDGAINSSLREGGANAVGEAIAGGVPVIASRIPGNVGLLGEDYPAYFDTGDTEALAELMWRMESDQSFRETLRNLCEERRKLFDRDRELEAFRALMDEMSASMHSARQMVLGLEQVLGQSMPVSDRRRHPRLPVNASTALELWSRTDEGNECHIVPVLVKDISAGGIAFEIIESPEIVSREFVAVAMPFSRPAISLPGRLVWRETSGGIETINGGVQFDLVAANDSVQREYLEWISRLLLVDDR